MQAAKPFVATALLVWALSGQLAAAGGTAPDLVPSGIVAANGTVGVTNLGTGPAPASVLTLSCQAAGGGSCPESPGMAAYEDPAFPNQVVVDVPALPPGGSFSTALTFWASLAWSPGNYVLTVTVDAASAVSESAEANNVVGIVHSVAGATVTGPGALRTAPSRAAGSGQPPAGSDTRVYAMPDIMATTLGFVLAGSPHPWGSTITVDLPHHASATRAGPNRNLCLFDQAAYRAFNKGYVATGPFVSKVTRNNLALHATGMTLGPQANQWVVFGIALPEGASTLKVRLDALNQVGESDESNNTPQVTVIVKLDCDGDGRIAGQSPLAIPAPAARLERPKPSLRLEPTPSRWPAPRGIRR